MTRERLTAALRPLVERMHVGHCWLKTAEGPRRLAQSFDEIKLSEHVTGSRVYGLCPITPGTSATRVACLDFDDHDKTLDPSVMRATAEMVAESLRIDGYHPHLFRSSGGRGVHLFMVFDEEQDAFSVRSLLNSTLQQCGLASGTGGVAAHQVEIFPKQDSVPTDGYGSMFILPFTGKAEPLHAFEGWIASRSVPLLDKPPKPERVATDTPDLERVKSALAAIPNDSDPLDYDAWRNIIFAIHDATGGSDAGLSLAHEFSARSGKYEPVFLDERVWPYIQSDRGGGVITARTLFSQAATHGWQDPAVVDDFDVLDEAPAATPEALPQRKRFTPIPADEFAKGRSPAWLIKGVLPRADLIVVYGESGSGKSFLALDMACALAMGLPWRGKRTVRSRVVYIAAEGSGGFRNRLNAYSAHHNTPLDLIDLAVIGAAPNMLASDDVVELIAEVGRCDLIVVDTWAQVTPGGNENSGEDMGKALKHCRELRRTTGATVLLIHHSGKDASKGARGWSGLRAAVDAEIEILRAEEDRVATVTKLKDGRDGEEFGFRLEVVPIGMDEDDEVIDSCVVEHTTAVVAKNVKSRALGDNEKIVWQAVMDLQGLDGEAPTLDDVLTEASKHIAQDPQKKKDRRREVMSRALNGMHAKGRVVINGVRVELPENE